MIFIFVIFDIYRNIEPKKLSVCAINDINPCNPDNERHSILTVITSQCNDIFGFFRDWYVSNSKPTILNGKKPISSIWNFWNDLVPYNTIIFINTASVFDDIDFDNNTIIINNINNIIIIK